MNRLSKSMGFREGMVLAITLVVGSGLFGTPGLVLGAATPAEVALGWVVTILGVFPLVLMLCRLGVLSPNAGGLSKYTIRALGPWGEDAVVLIVLGANCIGMPALGLVIAAYAQQLLGLPVGSQAPIAVSLFWLSTFVQLKGIRATSTLNLICSMLLLSLVLYMIGTHLPALHRGIVELGAVSMGKVDVSYHGIWKTSIVLFWAFIGWEALSFGLEEFKNPEKTIPQVYLGSFFLVSFIYLALGLTTVGSTLLGVPVLGEGGLSALLNSGEGYTKTLLLIIVVVGSANILSNMLAFSRNVFSAGREGILPRVLGEIDANAVPRVSIVFNAILYSVFCFVVVYTKLSLTHIFEAIDQAFVLLYVFCLIAYWKSERSWKRWPLSVACAISTAYFFSGFSWWLLYPIVCMILGYARYRSRTKSEKLCDYSHI